MSNAIHFKVSLVSLGQHRSVWGGGGGGGGGNAMQAPPYYPKKPFAARSVPTAVTLQRRLPYKQCYSKGMLTYTETPPESRRPR